MPADGNVPAQGRAAAGQPRRATAGDALVLSSLDGGQGGEQEQREEQGGSGVPGGCVAWLDVAQAAMVPGQDPRGVALG